MKLLLFSDLHRDRRAAAALVERAGDVDVVVGAGDFAVMRKGLRDTLEVLRAIDRPAVLVPGNGESYEELADACRDWPSARVLHGTGCEIDGRSFFGLGGGVPVTPFGPWSYDFTEDEAAELLRDLPEGVVLVSHSPPHGVLDRSSRGDDLGSATVRRMIDERRPELVVCGHIHDCAGQHRTVGPTVVVNAGPRGVLWELP